MTFLVEPSIAGFGFCKRCNELPVKDIPLFQGKKTVLLIVQHTILERCFLEGFLCFVKRKNYMLARAFRV
jgi:hypothetical protein